MPLALNSAKSELNLTPIADNEQSPATAPGIFICLHITFTKKPNICQGKINKKILNKVLDFSFQIDYILIMKTTERLSKIK